MKRMLFAVIAITLFALPSLAQMSEVRARVDGLT